MERRQSARVPVNLNAKIISEDKVFDGMIENMSEDGLEYFMTSFVKVTSNFTPAKSIKLNFQIPSGEMLNLNCELIWFLETSPDEKLLGMKVLNPPLTYRKIIKQSSYS
jgi:hypothetical protein